MDPVAVASPVDFDRYGDYGGYVARAGAERAAPPPEPAGAFVRPRYRFTGRLSADGSSGFPAVPGRYHLYISWACPWAHRSAIVRELKGLTQVVSLSAVDPVRDGRGWAFRDGDGFGPDPVNGFTLLAQAYEASEPGYDGHVSVPVLWDRVEGRIVSNNFPDITVDLDTAFTAYADPTEQLYPQALRPAIDALNEELYLGLNNGVYRTGFATSQAQYDEWVERVFATLDTLEERLAHQRYLHGDQLTESDVRAWVTLARFDAVYLTHFRCCRRRLVDYPNLWGYARDLYARPAFRTTTHLDQIRRHYFTTHPHLNPSRIIPVAPDADWDAPTDRARLGGQRPRA